MTRRCSHCNHNGHNTRTCPNRGVKLFGVRLTEGSIRKSASMGNLSHDVHDHVPGDGYVSEDFVAGRERKKGNPWTEEEHKMFLLGLQKVGKGDWRGISRNYVTTRTPTQVASHAQKYFIRQSNVSRRKRRSSLFDMVPDEVGDIPMDLQEPEMENIHVETEMKTEDSVHQTLAPSSLLVSSILENDECQSMDSTNSTNGETTATVGASFSSSIPEETTQLLSQPQLSGSFPILYPTYFSPYYALPFPVIYAGAGYDPNPTKHEIHRPTALHSKAPINVNELFNMSKLSLEESIKNGESDPSLSLNLGDMSSSRQSAFHPNSSSDKSVVHAV